MPEAYTHIRIARAALRAGGTSVASTAAYEMGANGPDPLFVYKVLSKQKPYPVAEMGSRLHVEQCGLFLQALLHFAKTPAQRSYALGFLTHYAADSVLHPYVAFYTSQGNLYDEVEGHGFCEVALDTYFYAADTGKQGVPANDAAPLLTTADLAEVCALLRRSIAAVFHVHLPALALADTFHTFRTLHKLFYSPHGGKKALGWAVDNAVLRRPGYAVSHMTPVPVPKEGFAQQWVHPFTKQVVQAGPNALAMQAVKLGAGYQAAAQQFWQRKISAAQLAQALGNNSYETGQPAV